jgi:hypothetical protein
MSNLKQISKNNNMKKLLFILLYFFSSTLFAQNNWEVLGSRLVNDRLERDVIPVSSTRGDFKALLFRVKGASVDFRKVKVVFGNGQEQDIELRNTIQNGSSSRVIDLVGKDRIIKEIIFWYDANTIRGKKAMVRVFGKN